MTSWCFAFRGDELLVRRADGQAEIPRLETLAAAGLPVSPLHCVAEHCVAVELPQGTDAPEGLAFSDLWTLGGLMSRAQWRLAGRAFQIVDWDRSHRFCGRCGAATVPHEREAARLCPSCQRLHFPRLSPAVIVLITRGREMLLARSSRFRPGVYSAIAGFVELGESLEEAVVREVREEISVEIADLRYFGSQQWPFPHSLMMGFTADYASGLVRPDPEEIEDVRWFSADALPILPPPISIARTLIDDFLRRHPARAGRRRP